MGVEVCGPNKTKEISTHPHKMSEAQVKNDVVAEAPSAEELKNLKRAAEGDEEEDLEGEGEDVEEDEEEGEGEGLFWAPGHFYTYPSKKMRKAKTKKGKEMKMRANKH